MQSDGIYLGQWKSKIKSKKTDEERFIIIGYSTKANLLFVVHAYKESETSIRIISARKASPKERFDFENIVDGGY